MATNTVASTLLDVVKTSASIVQHVRTGRYKLSQDFDNFADKVHQLQLKYEIWEDLLRVHGAQVQKLVKPSLEAAQKILHREEAGMKKREGRCWSACLEISFPTGRVDGAIQNVLGAFERIPDSIKEFNEARSMLNEVTTSDLAALPFSHDQKYVPLVQTVRQVRSALEDAYGPSVVTLHGPPGSGKTSMAKYLALLYDDIRKDGSSSRGFADGVLFLVCGSEATSETLHLELWQNLGCRANFDDSTTHGISDIMYERFFSESMLHTQLLGRVANRSILIILDDVKNSRVLEGILMPGMHIKYLVTSRNKRLWDDAKKIEISRPTVGNARKILFNHVVGFPESQPNQPEIQNAADYMIEKSDFNPLVLANLALTISSERAADPREWKTAKKYLLDILDDNDQSPVMFGEKYRHTVASSMTMAVNSMVTEAKHLLYLVAICNRPSVPEIVLMMFFKSLHGSLARFDKWANYLEDRALIQIETHAVDWTSLRQRTWSLHGLRRHFLLIKQHAEIAPMVSSLLFVKSEDDHIVTSLYLLYALTAASSEFTCTSIRPFVSLLHPDNDNEEAWQEQAHFATEQIISQYVCRGELDDACLATLLSIHQTQLAACWALETMARSENKALLTEENGSSLRNLLALLDERARPKRQSWAAVALGALARNNHEVILTHPEALQRLLHLLRSVSLAEDVKYNVQMYAAWALGNLAATPSAKTTIVEHVGMIDALLALLSRMDQPDSQYQAAYALRRLAYGELTETTSEAPSRQTRLIAHQAVLPTLVDLLGNDVHPDVQSEVVRTIGDLAASRENKLAIANHPNIFDRLVAMLEMKKTTSALRHRATYALRRLILFAGYPKLARIPSAFQRLVDVLLDDENLDAQLEAAHCMSFLSRQQDSRASFADNPEVLNGLVRLLDKDERPKSQLIAVGTLFNLIKDTRNMQSVALTPGALDGLVTLLAKNHDPEPMAAEVGQLAVRCLGFLSFEHYENQLKIKSTPGALSKLSKLLKSGPYMDPSDANGVQHLAAWTIGNLAQAEPNRAAILQLPGALENLRRLMEDSEMDSTLVSYMKSSIELLDGNSPLLPGQRVKPSTPAISSSHMSPLYKEMIARSKRVVGAGEFQESPGSSLVDESWLSEVQRPRGSWD